MENSVPHLSDHHYPQVFRQLAGYVRDHSMTVIRDDGQYRHLRFSGPRNKIGSFDLVTWPGSLVIRGDIGEGFLFAWGGSDVLPYFNQHEGHINPGYWSEKLTRGSREVMVFQEEKLELLALARIAEWDLSDPDIQEAREMFLEHWSLRGDEADCRQNVQDFVYQPPERVHRFSQSVRMSQDKVPTSDKLFEHICAWPLSPSQQALALLAFEDECLKADGSESYVHSVRSFSFASLPSKHDLGPDVDEWEVDDYDHHFLLACHAVLWGARKYFSTKRAVKEVQ